jgi:hypothetical protein
MPPRKRRLRRGGAVQAPRGGIPGATPAATNGRGRRRPRGAETPGTTNGRPRRHGPGWVGWDIQIAARRASA